MLLSVRTNKLCYCVSHDVPKKQAKDKDDTSFYAGWGTKYFTYSLT